jgi:hypothetical protein
MAALMTVWPSCVIRQRRERGDLGDQATHVKAFHEARDLPTAPGLGGGGGTEEPHAHVAVAKAVQGVLPAEHGGEQGEVGGGRRVEGAGGAAVAIAHRLPEAVEGPLGRGGIVDDGQGIEVAMIGRGRHGGIARQERHAFRQGVPLLADVRNRGILDGKSLTPCVARGAG